MTSLSNAMLSSDSEEEEEVEDVKEEVEDDEQKLRRLRNLGREEDDDNDSDEEEEIKDEDEEEASEDEEDNAEEGAELDDMTAPKPEPVKVEATTNIKSFGDLGIGSWLVKQLKSLHITRPTPVQAHCVDKVLEGCDVLGCAKTGTGKTLAFALPILHRLAVDPYGIYALVLTPTRELAFQIGDQFLALGKPISLKCSVIVGGRSIIEQARELTDRPHIVIATPGRLADLIDSNSDSLGLLFQKIKYFVLDEADRMLDGQYNDQLKVIFSSLPKKRQTLLFSATITSAINQLHQVSVKKPYFFEDTSDVATVEKLEQKYVLCPVAVKDAYLVYVVKNYCERNEDSSVMIFAQTCRECQALAYMFNGLGFQVGSLHSQCPQRTRLSSLAAFKSKTLRILICTDVAARGIDISHVDLVVNHNVPESPKTYVHRVGRSARAGRFGSALTFVTQYDVVLLQAVEELIGKKLVQQKINDEKVSKYVTKVIVSKREAEIKLEQQNFGAQHENNKRKQLLISGMTEEEADEYMDKSKRRKQNHNKSPKEKMNKPSMSKSQKEAWKEKSKNKKQKKKVTT